MRRRALHTAGDKFDVAKRQTLLNPLFDLRSGDQAAIGGTHASVPGQLPDTRFLQRDSRRRQELHEWGIFDHLVAPLRVRPRL
jgi:hypothetical protein